VEVRKAFPDFDSKRLVEWQEKGYLKKLINKWYIFSDVTVTENLLYRISNNLLAPSYISLESAFSYYNVIPESVFTQQAVATRKTTRYETPVGVFQYRSISESYYFGFRILRHENFPVRMAELEKALIDYFYLTPWLKTADDIAALRFNRDEINNLLNWEMLSKYTQVYNSPTLNKRIHLFRKTLS